MLLRSQARTWKKLGRKGVIARQIAKAKDSTTGLLINLFYRALLAGLLGMVTGETELNQHRKALAELRRMRLPGGETPDYF